MNYYRMPMIEKATLFLNDKDNFTKIAEATEINEQSLIDWKKENKLLKTATYKEVSILADLYDAEFYDKLTDNLDFYQFVTTLGMWFSSTEDTQYNLIHSDEGIPTDVGVKSVIERLNILAFKDIGLLGDLFEEYEKGNNNNQFLGGEM